MNEFATQQDKYVTFQSGNEYFGLKIEYVNEIIVFHYKNTGDRGLHQRIN